jgi:hypothetical protein
VVKPLAKQLQAQYQTQIIFAWTLLGHFFRASCLILQVSAETE